MSDEEFAPIALRIEAYGIGISMGQQCQWEPNVITRKRGPPGTDMEADPCGWIFESEHPDIANQRSARDTKKRRKTMDDEETWVWPLAESRELSVRRAPMRVKDKSKLGQHGLNKETIVAPLQGVPLPLAPGPSIMGAALGPYGYASQAWTEVREAHDEDETDRERWKRLIGYEKGRWICIGCGGQPFSDLCTLQRHCKSSVHAKERDIRGCPFCPKVYLRSSNVRRHIRSKHPEEWETAMWPRV